MFYKELNISDLINKKENDKQVVNLLERENSYLKLIYVKNGEGFYTKISHTDIFIYIIEGVLEITFPQKNDFCTCSACGCLISDENSDDKQKYLINKNQILMFEKDVIHNVTAKKDCTFILVKI